MQGIPRYIEEEYLTPPEEIPIMTCSCCGQDMFFGDDVWIIKNDAYCERCIEDFHEEIEAREREYEFDD